MDRRPGRVIEQYPKGHLRFTTAQIRRNFPTLQVQVDLRVTVKPARLNQRQRRRLLIDPA